MACVNARFCPAPLLPIWDGRFNIGAAVNSWNPVSQLLLNLCECIYDKRVRRGPAPNAPPSPSTSVADHFHEQPDASGRPCSISPIEVRWTWAKKGLAREMAPNSKCPKHEKGTFSAGGRMPPPPFMLHILIPMLMATMPGRTKTKVPGANLTKLLTDGWGLVSYCKPLNNCVSWIVEQSSHHLLYPWTNDIVVLCHACPSSYMCIW